MSAKSPACDISVNNIITRKDKHEHKAQIVNNHLKEMCTNKNINLIDHSKNIKHQHLNKSKLHLTKRATNMISTTSVREISNIFQWQCVLCSTNGEVTGSSSSSFAGCKSNSKKISTETNQLKSLRKSILNRLIFAHLNINSIRNKFEFLAKDQASNVDLLMISETIIDNSFPKGQFLIKGFCEPFRIDRNIHGGGILFYVREDNPVKPLSIEPLPTECFFVEINLQKRKWLVCCSYSPHKDNISTINKEKIRFIFIEL